VPEWLGISAVNPWLLAGGAATLAPILIHLLSRRRFREVDWAAMQFLLQAERRNRRRIRMEHLLLLLLRCLAVILIALLVARPYLQPTGLAALASPGSATERIVLVDDSPSLQALHNNRTVMDHAREALTRFVRDTAAVHPGDSLTLFTTSQPERPVIHGTFFEETDTILHTIDRIESSDRSADLAGAVESIELFIEQAEQQGTGPVNRSVYVLSDLRQRDWSSQPDTGAPQADRSATGHVDDSNHVNRIDSSAPVIQALQRLTSKAQQVVIIDAGGPHIGNIAVTGIRPADRTLVRNVIHRFEALVTNYSDTDAHDVTVEFVAGDAPSLERQIPRLKARHTAAVPFTFAFAEAAPIAIEVMIGPDALPHDNLRHFVADVQEGVRILLVDGEPSPRFGDAETFFLERALAPPGHSASGNIVEVITERQFHGIGLSRYDAVFLCNVYRVSDEQARQLHQWVKEGGGLAICPGDLVDPATANRMLATLTTGRLGNNATEHAADVPRLVEMRGDATHRRWATLRVEQPNHPLMSGFAGSSNPLLRQVKVFRWWHIDPGAVVREEPGTEPEAQNSPMSIPMVLDTAKESPAWVQRSVGRGRVVISAFAVDRDGSNWPTEPSYVVAMLKLADHLARGRAMEGSLPVGVTLEWPVDLSTYQPEARLYRPGQPEGMLVRARPREAGSSITQTPQEQITEPTADAEVAMVMQSDPARVRGIHELRLVKYDGTEQSRLKALNTPADEGDLRPADQPTLQRVLDEAGVQIIPADQYLAAGSGGRTELWPIVIIALVALLCGEQLLGLLFGRRR
jgi:hypothetical protein